MFGVREGVVMPVVAKNRTRNPPPTCIGSKGGGGGGCHPEEIRKTPPTHVWSEGGGSSACCHQEQNKKPPPPPLALAVREGVVICRPERDQKNDSTCYPPHEQFLVRLGAGGVSIVTMGGHGGAMVLIWVVVIWGMWVGQCDVAR